jgi:hypothetical protein
LQGQCREAEGVRKGEKSETQRHVGRDCSMSVVSRALIHIHKPAPVDDHPVAAPREKKRERER